MAFALTYAGIPFQLDDDKINQWIQNRIPLEDLCETQPPLSEQPEYNVSSLGAFRWPSRPKLRIGQYWYPVGLSRWSEFHGLATTSAVTQMASAAFSHLSGPVKNPFVMQCTAYPIVDALVNNQGTLPKLNLYMLPPRPLSNVTASGSRQFDNLWLVTLVDERYYNFARPVTLSPDGRSVTWTNVINSCLPQLGLPTVATTGSYGDAHYPNPDSAFWANSENAALLADAAAWNLGQVWVRNYDGTYALANVGDTTVELEPGLRVPTSLAGGSISQLKDTNNLIPALEAVLPATVQVAFPLWVLDYGEYQNSPVQAHYIPHIRDGYQNVFLSSQQLINATGTDVLGNMLNNYAGHSGTVRLRSTARAYQTNYADASPNNLTALNNLAAMLANQYWDEIANGIDEVYPGIRPWVQDGQHDIIFSYNSSRRATTRIMRRPWNWFPSDFQHYEASATGGSFLSDGPNAGPAIELIRAATGTPDGSGNYDAFVRRFNGTVYSDTEEVWMRIPNGETVTSGNQYLARLMQYASGRKVYTASIPGTGGGGGTGGAVLRVPSVGSGLVAAFVETWTDTAGAPMPADGTACYVFDPNANAINAQYYPGILTINHSDGKPIYAVQSGFTGTESICLGDGQYHTFTWAAGDLISVV